MISPCRLPSLTLLISRFCPLVGWLLLTVSEWERGVVWCFVPLVEGQQWLLVEGGRAQKFKTMNNMVRDTLSRGSCGEIEEGEHTVEEGCLGCLNGLGLLTAANWECGTWTLTNPCPTIALGQEELYRKKLCQTTLMKRLKLVTLPAACLKWQCFY